ncbi:MAG: NlpC/P60 family protein [Flavobacteriales bacterium]
MSEKIKWITAKQQYAFCALGVIPVRTSPSDAAEQCTQLLFGEPIEILAMHHPWIEIRTLHDGYEGFIDFKQVLPLTEKELRRWLDEKKPNPEKLATINGPMGLQLLPGSCFIGQQNTFQIGEFSYEISEPKDATKPTLNHGNIWPYISSFLNTPYLWGGRSIFGIDCSGFMQNIFRQLDYNLPRDAYQQAEHGTLIDFEERQALDLAFFINAQGKIHHVGLIDKDLQIIHASGQVRIDSLSPSGIWNEAAQLQTHLLFEIRRIIHA